MLLHILLYKRSFERNFSICYEGLKSECLSSCIMICFQFYNIFIKFSFGVSGLCAYTIRECGLQYRKIAFVCIIHDLFKISFVVRLLY